MKKHCSQLLEDDLIDLINQCLEHDSDKRLDIEGILNHKWMSGETATYDEVYE